MTVPAAGYTNAAEAAADGVIHYWPMGESSGTAVADPISTTLDGVVSGDVGDATIVAGKFTYARKLDGVDDLITLGAGGGSTTETAMTFAGWVYVPASIPAYGQFLDLNNLEGLGAGTGLSLAVKADGTVQAAYDANANAKFSTTSTVTTSAWNFITITLDTVLDEYIIRIDTVVGATNTYGVASIATDANAGFIGSWGSAGSDDYFDAMCEFALWNRVLTTSEITTLYGLTNPLISAWVSVTESLSASTASTAGLHFLIEQSLNMIETNDPGWRPGGVVIEALTLGATPVGAFVLGSIISEAVNIPDTATPNQVLGILLSESVSFTTTFAINGETYTGIVVNTENFARSSYSGFDFNSLGSFNGSSFGAKDDGIYELVGDDDAGTDIAAHITTGITDFGSSEEKRLMRAYLGLRNDGPIVLKTVVTDPSDGQRREYWYELTDTSAGIRQTRMKVGRGLKANYWQFELANKEGADFELDLLELVPIILTRKI